MKVDASSNLFSAEFDSLTLKYQAFFEVTMHLHIQCFNSGQQLPMEVIQFCCIVDVIWTKYKISAVNVKLCRWTFGSLDSCSEGYPNSCQFVVRILATASFFSCHINWCLPCEIESIVDLGIFMVLKKRLLVHIYYEIEEMKTKLKCQEGLIIKCKL